MYVIDREKLVVNTYNAKNANIFLSVSNAMSRERKKKKKE
jgi:hypothetical protein